MSLVCAAEKEYYSTTKIEKDTKKFR